MSTGDIGLIGLAVMGQNLALNLSEHGFEVVVHNRTRDRMEAFLDGPARRTGITAAPDLRALCAALRRPRKLFLMVRAGAPVDELISRLLPELDPEDIVIDGGNSHFADSNRRCDALANRGIRFVGCGISGGEEGARRGPSIMPGGDARAWPVLRPLLQTIAAVVDTVPCCQWIGPGGAGHYVKMVHNGIEYGDMQLISEAYHLMRNGLGLDGRQIQKVFEDWNASPLESYLIEITARILDRKGDDGSLLLDRILDSAGQKGTGKWTGINALELGVPLTLIDEAVYARCLSVRTEERQLAKQAFPAARVGFEGDLTAAVTDLQKALYASKIISYAQGFMLMREAADVYKWEMAYGDIAQSWRGGCIIRSRFLNNIREAFTTAPSLPNLLLDDYFTGQMRAAVPGWRRAVRLGMELGIPLPAMASALSFFDGYRCGRLPANLIQAQRDYFGAHGYERVDRPRGEIHHTDWTGSGGPASSSIYQSRQ